jgi:uncharacterized protein
VTEPAIEGRANRAVLGVVADELGVPRSSVSLVRGERARDKVLEVKAARRAR